MRALFRITGLAVVALAGAPAQAQLENFEENVLNAEITAQQISEGFYVLFGYGGNIAASIGEDGVLIVDTQFPEITPKYLAAIAELGGDGVDVAINTHWHFDHADGNMALGPIGVELVAHENSRDRLRRDNVINLVSSTRQQPAYPRDAIPTRTFSSQMRIDFNAEQIDLLHFGPAHTTGDTVVIFRNRNIVHTGDVFVTAGYPFIDTDNGGSFEGLIDFCRATMNEIDTDTVVIPGHGRVSDFVEIADYVSMLGTIRDRMRALIDDGATLEQIAAAGITAEWDAERGDPANFLDRAYASMTR
jgi:cyclase